MQPFENVIFSSEFDNPDSGVFFAPLKRGRNYPMLTGRSELSVNSDCFCHFGAIPPSGLWIQVVDRGQASDNSTLGHSNPALGPKALGLDWSDLGAELSEPDLGRLLGFSQYPAFLPKIYRQLIRNTVPNFAVIWQPCQNIKFHSTR